MSHIHREFTDSREAFEAEAWAEYEAYLDGERFNTTNIELSEAWHDEYYGQVIDSRHHGGDGQPDEYTEWQDFMGGDDWDQGQYDN